MTKDSAAPSSPKINPTENEPAPSTSPKAAGEPAAVESPLHNLALATPAKDTTFGGKIKGAGAWMKDYGTALKHGSFKPFCLTERKTRAATRNQAWGPVGQELNELAALSHFPTECSTIFKVLSLRLDYPPEKWRNVYKALSVIEFLVKRGSEDAVTKSKDFITRLEYLESFAYITPDSRDVGGNVRHRARAIRALLQDEKRLKVERNAAAKQQSRMAGRVGTEEWRQSGSSGVTNTNDAIGKGESDGKEPTTSSPSSPKNSSTTTTKPSTSLPNAGETKGVSPEANARHLTALKKILARPENALCADCGVPGAGHRPTWASISLGVFVCMRCAGVHRGLGVHISQVRSCSLDSWLAPQVEFMASCGGNLRANQYWEARLPEGKKPPVATLADLDNFLRRKYTDKEFVAVDDHDDNNDGGGSAAGGKDGVSTWPPSAAEVEFSIMDAELKKILEDMLPESERESAVLAREAAEAQAAALEKLKKEEEAAKKKVKEEEEAAEKARIEAEKAAESQVDLINLLDLDFGETTTTTANVHDAAAINGTSMASSTAAGVDPFAALESIFIPSSSDTTAKTEPSPPATIDAWDMGAMLAAQQAQHAAEEAIKARKAAEDAAAAAAAEAAAAHQAAYRPPWAPSSGPTAAGASPSPLGITVPALSLTAGPAAAFQDGFSGVPHQFTSTPVVPQGHVAHQYGWAQTPSPNSLNTSTTGNAMNAARPATVSQRPLQPHELRAQQLVLNGLDLFNAHASLVSVKQQPSPVGSALSPGSIGGVSPPLKSFRSPSPGQ